MERIDFKNSDEYKKFLEEQFYLISKDDEYNIFMHCVTNATKYFVEKISDPKEDIARRVAGILKVGLNLDGAQDYGNYGSINGTARFFGSSKTANIDKVVNYDYFSRSNEVNSIIIAIPKYVDVYGDKVEFSSYNGSMKHADQHVKDCLFDLIKGFYLPVEFIWAHQVVNKDNGAITLNLNEKHLTVISNEEKKKFMDDISKKCEEVLDYCIKKYGVKDFEDIFKSMTDEHMDAIDDYLNEP